MPLAPPSQTPLVNHHGHVSPAWHRYLLNLAGAAGTGDGGDGTTPLPAEPLVTGDSPTDFITADGDIIVASYG